MDTPLEIIVNKINLARTQPAMSAAMLETILEEKKVDESDHQTQKVDDEESTLKNIGNLVDIAV